MPGIEPGCLKDPAHSFEFFKEVQNQNQRFFNQTSSKFEAGALPLCDMSFL